jgi:hypothetical protein
MKPAIRFTVFLISLFALGASPAGARTLDGSQSQRNGVLGEAVATATNFDLVLRERTVPADALRGPTDEELALSCGLLSKGFKVRKESNFAATAQRVAQANDGSGDAAPDVPDNFEGLPSVPQTGGGVISSLRGSLGLDGPLTDDDQTITGTAVSFTQGAETEAIPEMHWDFWLTPGAARPNPWPILEPLMAEGTVFMGLLAAIIAAWAIARHRQLEEP